jgi:hypothetical protein
VVSIIIPPGLILNLLLQYLYKHFKTLKIICMKKTIFIFAIIVMLFAGFLSVSNFVSADIKPDVVLAEWVEYKIINGELYEIIHHDNGDVTSNVIGVTPSRG